MVRWVVLVAAVMGCRSEGGVSVPLPPPDVHNPQDLGPQFRTDVITQVTIPAVDVLFVVDNSCSMSEEQKALGANFPAFIRWFLESSLDYHIGVVSMDMRDPEHGGQLRDAGGVRWIDAQTPGAEGVFAEMVQMGTGGHFQEEGRAAAFTAVEKLATTFNKGFIRPDAGLHITVVSDEDDGSTDSPVSRSEFVHYLQTARPTQRMVSFSSIVGPVTGCPTIGEPGSDYMAVTNLVGGVIWPICSDDWTVVLDDLGFLAVGLSREFHLSDLPVANTVSVSVETEGVVVPFDETSWVYSEPRNSIRFLEFVPDPLATVSISYQLLSSGVRDLQAR
ncbi:MAG: hypothetical protein KTR31_12990 [Myxococcales bacterium]|nr:hypothetical protein [Myxococcales bacterium]